MSCRKIKHNTPVIVLGCIYIGHLPDIRPTDIKLSLLNVTLTNSTFDPRLWNINPAFLIVFLTFVIICHCLHFVYIAVTALYYQIVFITVILIIIPIALCYHGIFKKYIIYLYHVFFLSISGCSFQSLVITWSSL